MNNFYEEVEKELTQNILPFWINNTVDNENGGFYGYISRDMETKKEYEKSSVINARILWTFSRAFRKYSNNEYLNIAQRAYEYIKTYFLDKENDGVYWLVDFKGNPFDTKKQVYAQAFTVYGLAEYYDITKDKDALQLAYQLFNILEEKCKDTEYGGYFDAFSQLWEDLDDTSLSETDMSCPKTMNTNLHVMEAYANLYRVTKDSVVAKALEEVVCVCLEKICDRQKSHFLLYFDREWNKLADENSFGHDIEGSWLICEAVDLLNNKDLKEKAYEVALDMAKKVLRQGVNPIMGGMLEEARGDKIISSSTQWWVFAEAVIGFFNAYEITGERRFLEASYEQWDYIKNKIVDRKNGEWYWGITNDGKTPLGDEKVSSWKCPYHNSRMCIEIMERIEKENSK